MPDDMFFSKDFRTLVKGQRRDRRTTTRRLAEFRTARGGSKVHRGIVLDLNAYSMRIRTAVRLAVGTPVEIDLKRQGIDGYMLSTVAGRVARLERVNNRQFDLGVELDVPEIERPAAVMLEMRTRRGTRSRPSERMHIIDFVVGG